jgi:hypothetical protein
LCIKEGSNKIGELRLAAIFAPALSASVSSCAKRQALGFFIRFSAVFRRKINGKLKLAQSTGT